MARPINCRMCNTYRPGKFCHACGHVDIDPNIAAAVRKQLKQPQGPLTKEVIRKLTNLDASGTRIYSWEGLDSAVNLTELSFRNTQIDRFPLGGSSFYKPLLKLTTLYLDDNHMSDVSSLASFTNLTLLSLINNRISDISPLASLTKLTGLSLGGNRISDVSPLSSLTKLTSLSLNNNQISDVGPLFDNPGHCSDCEKELTKDGAYCPDCGEKRVDTAGSFPNLTELLIDVDELIDKSPLASLLNLEKLNGQPFVREDFLSAEPDESPGDPEEAGPEKSLGGIKTVNFVILPTGAGWWTDPKKVSEFKIKYPGTEKQFEDFMDRLFFADSKGPIGKYESKFNDRGYQYYVFVYPNHVIAECPQYGNAAYVLTGTDNWQSIFSRSRPELRNNFSHRVTWIRHTKTWKERLRKYLN